MSSSIVAGGFVMMGNSGRVGPGSSGPGPSGPTRSPGPAPSGTTPSGPAPSGTTLSGTIPSGTTLSGTIPSGTTPSGTTPSGTTPSGTTLSGTIPSGTIPSGTTPPASCSTYTDASPASSVSVACLRDTLRSVGCVEGSTLYNQLTDHYDGWWKQDNGAGTFGGIKSDMQLYGDATYPTYANVTSSDRYIMCRATSSSSWSGHGKGGRSGG